MRPIDVKTLKYRDNLASKRRQRAHRWWGLGVFGSLLLIVALGYALFYTPWFQVNSVQFEGLSSRHQSEVQKIIDEELNRGVVSIPMGRNILFTDTDELTAHLRKLPFLESIALDKDLFHTLKVSGTERQMEGVWCFLGESSPDCNYFDSEGVKWGGAIQSSGSLLLNVDDLRPNISSPSTTVDQRFLAGIKTVVPGLHQQEVKTKKVIIPADSYTEFQVIVSEGYPLKFSLDSDLSRQLEVYQIFRDQKITDKNFRPEYIDLRFDGRVYFK